MSDVALFDLDGTLTWHDTLLPFLGGYLLRHPARLLCLWRLPAAVLSYLLGGRDRGALKSRLIRMLMGGDRRADIDAWAADFVGSLHRRGAFRPGALAALDAHRARGDRLVLLSASPDLYVPRIGALLGFERTLCTEVTWQADRLEGALAGENRRGEEKSRCLQTLRTLYPNQAFVAYGNSASDLPHLALADRALLVNAGASARRLARGLGIESGKWT